MAIFDLLFSIFVCCKSARGDHTLDPDVTVSRPLRRLGLDSAKGVRIARS